MNEAAAAVKKARAAFSELAKIPDERVTSFFVDFAGRIRDDRYWDRIAAANESDVAAAEKKRKPTGRLRVSQMMREDMAAGLEAWARLPSRIGEVIETRDLGDATIERRRAQLGVVAFVFEGRPNVFADATGVLRGGNVCVLRIGSDALGTATAIQDEIITPCLRASGLPVDAIQLLKSPAHSVAQELFATPGLSLAVARGSGATVRLLGDIARSNGINASLHGTGGAWMYLAADAGAKAITNAVFNSLDRKVCNTLNVLLFNESVFEAQLNIALAAINRRSPQARLHATFDLAGAALIEDLTHEWEWEETPELSLTIARDDDHAVELINDFSPKLAASIITPDSARFESFYRKVDVPFVSNGFTRWVDGQWAWVRPELGLSNWQSGRIQSRSAILSADDVYCVRDVFMDKSGKANQTR